MYPALCDFWKAKYFSLLKNMCCQIKKSTIIIFRVRNDTVSRKRTLRLHLSSLYTRFSILKQFTPLFSYAFSPLFNRFHITNYITNRLFVVYVRTPQGQCLTSCVFIVMSHYHTLNFSSLLSTLLRLLQ